MYCEECGCCIPVDELTNKPACDRCNPGYLEDNDTQELDFNE